MISIKGITKKFDDYIAVNQVDIDIREGMVFGLIGTNGAGKSTLLRMMCGVMKPDEGMITVDDMPVYDNPAAKEKIFFIADEPYFFPHGNAVDMEQYYSMVYKSFDKAEYYKLLQQFGLESKRKIATYSKGMKKQLAVILALASRTDYILCDETFDGLDPVMRQAVKSLLAKEMGERGLTPVIASHNLRELEDICDTVGLLHKGGVLLSKDLDEMKCGLQKIQCVFKDGAAYENALSIFDIIKKEHRGSLYTLTVRGGRDEIAEKLNQIDTVFCEVLPLSLEEIFISETEVVGYDIKKLILEV
ncbi:MAG: ABC transporter ATP-binding protein [Lachnospiraceae bacterium]|nr:ABC transporter ATP-binding protein [Lachnospiraceae bacterium]MDD5853793.1 ABC transporter ATP-binding protein [Lachnospiraceae bacterium]